MDEYALLVAERWLDKTVVPKLSRVDMLDAYAVAARKHKVEERARAVNTLRELIEQARK